MKKRVLIGYIKDDKSDEIVNSLYEYFALKNTFEIKILDLGEFTNSLGKVSLNVYNKVRNNSNVFSLFHGIVNNNLGSKSFSKAVQNRKVYFLTKCGLRIVFGRNV